MAYDHVQIIRAQYEELANERSAALAALEAARVNESSYEVMRAADRVVDADVRRSALDNIARNFVASQNRPQGNQFGLNRDEVDIAHGIGGGDPNLSNQERERLYAYNRDKLRHMRATGQYSDGQGVVTR
jgi:hypothetical protein